MSSTDLNNQQKNASSIGHTRAGCQPQRPCHRCFLRSMVLSLLAGKWIMDDGRQGASATETKKHMNPKRSPSIGCTFMSLLRSMMPKKRKPNQRKTRVCSQYDLIEPPERVDPSESFFDGDNDDAALTQLRHMLSQASITDVSRYILMLTNYCRCVCGTALQ